MPAATDEATTRSDWISGPDSALGALLELLGLWTLAALEPLLEILGGSAPFLLHHRPDAVDLAAVALVLALGPPVLLWLVEIGVGRLADGDARRLAHRIALAALVAVAVLGVLRKLGDPVSTWLLLPLTGIVIWLGLTLLERWRVLRRFFSLCALLLPVVLGLFWVSSGARAARATAADAAGPLFPDHATPSRPSADLAPLVWIVFDELPLASILDADLGIDKDLCPNLAAFAEVSTWYRNATTVWSSTNESIASMLTGRVGDLRAPPTREHYPDNLLTWLDATHRIRAFERVTSLAPAGALELLPRATRARRLSGLLLDAAIVGAHLFLPPDLSGPLPPIDTRWGDFWSPRVVRGRGGDRDPDATSETWAFALADGRAAEFADFLETVEPSDRPGAHFVHVMLPHMPYRYLPSGRVYGGRPVYGQPADAWSGNEWFALETYQRHLLQVGYVDRLIGDLRARLEEIGLWSDSIVVLTSDHGVSHWPGQDRRLPRETDHPDDILRVPLLIKAPGQSAGRIEDRPARAIDIAPTVAALLGQPLPWVPDGVDLDGDADLPATVPLFDPRGGELSFGTEFAPDAASLARKLDLFDPEAGRWRFSRLGPYRNLVGRAVGSETALAPAAPGCRAVIDQLPVLRDFDPQSRFSPAFLTGTVECDRRLPSDTYLAAALNGVVSGLARLQLDGGGRTGDYALMAAEAALAPGRNELDLFLVSGPPETPVVEPVAIPIELGRS